MLTTCPECTLQISDKAIACPHCGYPLKEPPRKRSPKKHGHRRLPNGFGRITKINRNLANPYRVMVTAGHDEYGKPIGKLLKPKAYFPTYNDAYMALVEYNRKPYELDNDMTMAELYKRWYASVESTVTKSTLNGYNMAWNYCSSAYDAKVREVRARHIHFCIERGTYEKDGIIRASSPVVKARIKQVWNMILDYAVQYELVDRNIARMLNLPKTVQKELSTEDPKHLCFTEEELNILWTNLDKVPFVDLVLFQCYCGWRPAELGLIRLTDVDLDSWLIRGGLKTKAGRDRIVPVHTCIRSIVENMYNTATKIGSEYLVNATDSSNPTMTYDKYDDRFQAVVKALNLNPAHRPHDPRKQFVTMAKAAGMNEYAIKRIAGHTIKDITEKIYTERSPKWLSEEIEKIKGPAKRS